MTLRTGLIVAVPEAAPTVDGWRERTCGAKPSAGWPPHVTVLFPFLPAAELDQAIVDDLGALFRAHTAFPFQLREALTWPDTLYLAPEPAAPFKALTGAVVARYPAHPPYGGEFGLEPIPHLTVAQGDSVLGAAQADVTQALPIGAWAREVVLVEEVVPDSRRWEIRARFPLSTP